MPRIARMVATALILTLVLLFLFRPTVPSFETERQQVRQLLDDGLFAEGVQRAEQLRQTARSSAGSESFRALAALDLLVESRVLNGDGAQPSLLATAQEVVAVKRRVGANPEAVATSLRNLGMVLIANGDYEAARRELERAVQQIESAVRADDLRLADALNSLGAAETRTEHYDAADRTLARALELRERLLGPSHRLVAQTLEHRGYLLLQKGAYAEARPLLERALRISEVGFPRHPDTAALLCTLGTLAWFEGNVRDSERFYRRAVELARQSLPVGHPAVAFYERNLAGPLWWLGRTSEARDLRLDAVELGRRAFGETHPEFVWGLNDLALSHMEFGEYQEARRLFEEALAAVVTRSGPNHLNVATVQHNLALLYAYLGDKLEAGRRLEQALEIWQRVLGPAHPYVGRALDSLAEVFRDEGRYADARALLERALKIRVERLGPDHREVAESLTSLGALLVRSGRPSEATMHLAKALRIWESVRSTNEPGYAAAVALTGEAQVLAGSPNEGRRSFERALTLQVALVGPAHPLVSATKVGLGSALLGLHQNAAAMRLGLEAEAAGRDHLRLTTRYLSEHEGLSYASTRRRGLDLALSVPIPRAGGDTAALLDAVIRSRALVLDEMSERHAAVRQTGSPKIDALLVSVSAARQRFASVLVRASSNQSPRDRELLSDAKREMEAAERQLAEHSVEFSNETARKQTGLEQILASLPAATALISFVRYAAISQPTPESRYVAFVVTGGTVPPAMVQLGTAADIEDLVRRWRVEISRGAVKEIGQHGGAEQAYRAAAAALRRRIWDPLVPFIGAQPRVFIVPDGALNLVSFASLPADGGRYLVEQGPIVHYLGAERNLVSAAADSPRQGTLLALGGPDFDLSPVPVSPVGSVVLQAPPRELPERRGTGVTCANFEDAKFQPLAETAHEVDDIAAIWQNTTRAPSTVLTGRLATEQALRRLAPHTGILHLATHGFFLATDCVGPAPTTRGVGGLTGPKGHRASPLRLSGLALAGANHRGRAAGGDDGILMAEEVAALDLSQAQWVVLSACETGVGEVSLGEGVLGLRSAFRIAGARTLIMSLWAVDDEATRLWMRALYENRFARRLDTAASARAAALSVLNGRRAAGQSAHPFYWASFVAAGDWR